MIPGIWIVIAVFSLVMIVLGWLTATRAFVAWWFCLGINLGFIALWYSPNIEILEHFHYVYHKTQIEKSK